MTYTPKPPEGYATWLDCLMEYGLNSGCDVSLPLLLERSSPNSPRCAGGGHRGSNFAQ